MRHSRIEVHQTISLIPNPWSWPAPVDQVLMYQEVIGLLELSTSQVTWRPRKESFPSLTILSQGGVGAKKDDMSSNPALVLCPIARQR